VDGRRDALAAGAVPFDRWATARRLRWVGVAFVGLLVLLLPVGLPVLPLQTAADVGVLDARSDYQDEVGWHGLARDVDRFSLDTDVVLARNYGEAGAVELFGHVAPPVASPQVTFRYWRPAVAGRRALLVGFRRREATFCRTFRLEMRIRMPVDNEERDLPIGSCTLDAPLASLWPRLVAQFGT
jgi:hypothetical protein